MTQPTDDDARLAKMRERHDGDCRFLLRLLDEARADERKKLAAKLRELRPALHGAEYGLASDDARKSLRATYNTITGIANLLERAP